MNKIDIHESICRSLHDLYVRKNADYGDSFSKVRMDIPNAILVRLSDKLNRLKSLMNSKNERQVNDESIDDTLMDLANYCLLELTERRWDELKTVEPERRKGELKTVGFLTCQCSECGAQFHELEYTNYCPNCGADIAGLQEGEVM